MKKKSQIFKQDFKMPRLFREDLVSIEKIIKQELNPREYKLELEAFEYSEITEITDNAESTSQFHIQTCSPYISIDFSEINASIYTGDDEIKTVGAVKKILDVIVKRERKWLWYSSKLSSWLSPLVFVAAVDLLLIFTMQGWQQNKAWLIIMAIVLLLSVCWWVIGYRSALKKFSIIEFVYRKNQPGFFAKNKDQIFVGVVIAVITVFATLFFQHLFE